MKAEYIREISSSARLDQPIVKINERQREQIPGNSGRLIKQLDHRWTTSVYITSIPLHRYRASSEGLIGKHRDMTNRVVQNSKRPLSGLGSKLHAVIHALAPLRKSFNPCLVLKWLALNCDIMLVLLFDSLRLYYLQCDDWTVRNSQKVAQKKRTGDELIPFSLCNLSHSGCRICRKIVECLQMRRPAHC